MVSFSFLLREVGLVQRSFILALAVTIRPPMVSNGPMVSRCRALRHSMLRALLGIMGVPYAIVADPFV